MEYPSIYQQWTKAVPTGIRLSMIRAIARKNVVSVRTCYRVLHGLTRPSDRTKRIYKALQSTIEKCGSGFDN